MSHPKHTAIVQRHSTTPALGQRFTPTPKAHISPQTSTSAAPTPCRCNHSLTQLHRCRPIHGPTTSSPDEPPSTTHSPAPPPHSSLKPRRHTSTPSIKRKTSTQSDHLSSTMTAACPSPKNLCLSKLKERK